jgi:glycogen(starch) synthase
VKRKGHRRRDERPMHVLRLASVYEPESRAFDARTVRFDPIGGMQNHTASLSRALDRLGVAQTVITSRLDGPTGSRPVGSLGRVHRVGVPTPYLRQLWALCAVPHLAVAMRRRVDVVHAHQGEDIAVLLLALGAAALHRCPLVVTVHCSVRLTVTGGGLRHRALRLVGGTVERLALHRADAVLALVPHSAHALVAAGLPSGRVHVLPSGFEPALFAGAVDDVLSQVPRPRVGYVGRLAEQKAPQLLVAAFADVATDASLVIVGDGPLRRRVQSAVQRSAAGRSTLVRGFVAHDDMPSVLASLDLLVLPSIYEEMGSVLVEAMASGLPVVASAVGGIPDVVEDGVTGLLVPPGDVGALTKAIEELLTDCEKRSRMAEAARARSAHYEWPALARRAASVYGAVLRR